MAELSMSKQAVGRHTSNLQRRGYVHSQVSKGRRSVYELSRAFKTPLHAKMLAIVRSAWVTAASRAS